MAQSVQWRASAAIGVWRAAGDDDRVVSVIIDGTVHEPAERVGPYEGTGGTGNDLNGGGIVINSWDPLALRGLSDFNPFHQINSNVVYHLPFGRGQMLAGCAGRGLEALIGGWHASGIVRWTSGFPITVDNCPCWATNWNIEGDAMPIGPAPLASHPKHAFVNGVNIGPDIFANPARPRLLSGRTGLANPECATT